VYVRLSKHFVLEDARHRHTAPDARHTLAWNGQRHHRVDTVDGMVEFKGDATAERSVPLRKDMHVVCRHLRAIPGEPGSTGNLDRPKTSLSCIPLSLYLTSSEGIARIEGSVLDGVPNFVSVEAGVCLCRVRMEPERTACR
jgi:hypothetical protein